MTESLSPPTEKEYPPLTPEEMLVRSAVLNLATVPETQKHPDDVLQWGYLRQPGARFLLVQVTSKERIIQEELEEPYGDHVLEIHAWDSSGNKIRAGERRKGDGKNQTARGSVQILKLSTSTVTCIANGEEYVLDRAESDPDDVSALIEAYFKDNRLKDIPRLRPTPRNT